MTAFSQPVRPRRTALRSVVGWAWLVACAASGGEAAVSPAEPIAEIRLPFRPASLALSGDGRHAAVWEIRSGAVGPATAAGPRLCLVDLQAHRIAGQRELNRSITAVTVGSRAVLVLHGETIQVLRRADLTPVTSLVLTRPASDLILVDDRWLFVRQPRCWNVLQLPERIESPLLRMLLAERRSEELLPPVVPVSGGWRIGSAVLDVSLQQIQFFHALSPLAHTGLVNRTGGWEPALPALGRRQFALQKRTWGPLTLANGTSVSATMQPERTGRDSATRVLIEARTADGRQRRVPPCRVSGTVTQVSLLGVQQTVAFLAGDRLFALELDERGGEVPTQPSPLSVHPQPGTLFLSPSQKTTVTYTIRGGQGPYTLRPAAWSGPWHTDLEALIVTGEQPHTLVVDGGGVAAAATADRYGVPLAAEICARVTSAGPRSAEDAVADYINQANRWLAHHVGREFHDVPVAVAVGLTVTDAAAARSSLSHDMILEVPRAAMVNLVRRELMRLRPGAGPADFLAESDGSRFPELPLLWPENATPAFLSELTRRTWPPVAVPAESVSSQAAEICLRNLDADFKFSTSDPPQNDPRPERTWRTRSGRTYPGRLAEIVGGNVSIVGPTSSALVPSRQLDALSLRWAWQDVSRFQSTDAAYEKRKLELVGRALQAYYVDHGCFPPQALVESNGRPLLSWRVLLLPYLGQAALLQLFRLDEPWDSEHNRQLLPCMPLLYTTAEHPLDPGYSNVVAIVGPQTTFPPRALRRLSEFTDPPEETLAVVDVVEQGAVPWTQPADLDIFGGGRGIERLSRRTVARVFGDPEVPSCTGVFADGTVAYFAPPFAPDLLLNAARVDDGQWGGLRGDDRR